MTKENLLLERLAIEDVFALYAHAADEYDADSWVECFTEDGIFEVENRWKSDTVCGSSGIAGFYPCAYSFTFWYPSCSNQSPCEYRGR